MTVLNTVERAKGRWHEILPRLGIDARFLTNRHGPCPLCGGKDRFRFDDKNGAGSYYCNQCGPGPGLLLIRKTNGWDYLTACNAVDEIIGTDAPPPQAAPRRDDGARRLADIERTLAEATDRSVVERYLRARGLSVIPDVLRGHRALAYFGDDNKLIGRYPAVIAPIVGPDGRLQSAHRIYLTEPRIKKFMPKVNSLDGPAVRLFEATDEMIIGEGVETSIALHEIFGLPAWAVLSTSIMAKWEPPAGVTHLVIGADNDANFAGQAAAYALANRLARDRKNIAVEVMVPPEPDTDWLDQLNERRQGRAA